MSLLMQSLIAAAVMFLVWLDYEWVHIWTYRPIVLGPLMGLCLGNLQIGIEVGATIELMFLATVWVGSAVPPNEILSTGIATALAVTTKDATVAIATALPIAVLGSALLTFRNTFMNTFAMQRFEKAAENADVKGMKLWGIVIPVGLYHLILFVIPTFIAVYYGADVCVKVLEMIPSEVLVAINCGGRMIGAVGLALLLKSISFDKAWPFFFLGFIFSAYLGVGNLGITMLAVVAVGIIYMYKESAAKQD